MLAPVILLPTLAVNFKFMMSQTQLILFILVVLIMAITVMATIFMSWVNMPFYQFLPTVVLVHQPPTLAVNFKFMMSQTQLILFILVVLIMEEITLIMYMSLV